MLYCSLGLLLCCLVVVGPVFLSFASRVLALFWLLCNYCRDSAGAVLLY